MCSFRVQDPHTVGAAAMAHPTHVASWTNGAGPDRHTFTKRRGPGPGGTA